MDALRKAGNLTLVAMFVVVALAIAFWVALLSPKREEAAKLGNQIERVEASLAGHRAEIAEGEEARRGFSEDYQKLVVLGKAVPGDSETASLFVQVSGLAERVGVEFRDIKLDSTGGSEEAPNSGSGAGGGLITPTEAAASLLPLGASLGSGGLAVMPYKLTFNGSFFKIADFIKEIDAMVKSHNQQVRVDGRLLTIDGFSLAAGPAGFPSLTATFGVTSYVTPPPSQSTGLEAPSVGASESSATPAAAQLGGTP